MTRRTPLRVAQALPLLAAVAIALGVLWCGLARGSRVAGGADSYGYVSQSELWREGRLRIPQELAASAPWPNADWTFAPLGYRPAANHDIVPSYPPGLPLLMALFAIAAGRDGPYYVAPFAAAALILLTFALGRRVAGPAAGLAAALCLAASPVFLFMTLWPMSDVPVAALWTASLLLALRRTTAANAAAAITAGVAILVRPNLAPLAVVPAIVAAWAPGERPARTALRRLVLFALTLAPFVAFLGVLFNYLYGSPLRSGYGEGLFRAAYVPSNLARYPRWLVATQGPLVFLFALAPVLLRHTRAAPTALLSFALLTFACYLPYLNFEDWSYLRFLLPAFPMLFILAAAAAGELGRRAGRHGRHAAIAVFAAITIAYGAFQLHQREVLGVAGWQERYVDAGRHVSVTLPSNAIIYSMQHSGSVRYYSGRPTLRYDHLPPDWLDRSIAYLRQRGYEPYFVLDDWEVPRFRERFAGQANVAFVQEPRTAPCAHATYVFRVVDQWATRVPRYGGCND